MRSSCEPPLVPPATSGNLTDCVVTTAREVPGHVTASRKLAGGDWEDVTAGRFLADVTAVAKGLLAAGVQPGDRVALMARTSYDWTVVDVATWFAGAVTVPVYETSSAEQVQWILSDSGAVACFAETTDNAARVASVREHLPQLRDVWTLASGALDELRAAGRDTGDDELEGRRTLAGPGDPATVIYTSGTTGRPKGCVLTHGNFLDLAVNAREAIPEVLQRPDAATLLFIPLAHVFARFIQVLCLVCRVRVGHTPDAKDLLTDLGGFRPTFVLAVPRVFQKVYNGAEQRAAGGGRLKAAIFERASATAVAYSRALDAGGPSLPLRARHALFDRLVYGKLRALLGGNVEHAVSGGAPMGEHLTHFFRGVGLVVLEGYGLTETTAPLCVNRPSSIRVGTVGLPLPGTDVAVAEDGELLCRGVGVFREYRGREDETAEAFRDGWFRTGDLGEVLDSGHVRITGRKKEIIVTANGKNVVPATLEDRLRAHPLVSQAVVVGEGRHYVACLITLDEEALPSWGANHGRPGLDLASARTDEVVLAALQRAVDDANEAVSRAESVRRFRVLEDDFTIENGYLTPSQKVKRAEVLRDFAGEVDALYA
ncbi:AMP-dependent synthetase/ligase [Paenibacillus sp. TRM 82003]|uniref:AMP-dependent synthetase/ligase n=1 Tax=Kineococcus sp. TRM81007 TaxID=2925831 RepID=UPI001F5945AC|nr:AMP-dependent synthetase/ligase [Kineococcus sp. TRM81007]MCI2239666.1 AMP-dependent synthetase/ligase [Kineococcus sp. TRM81007]MCI3926770.1 AMP-dependent synthetase/ligase [Paenibacillus sp. TRM 82003]